MSEVNELIALIKEGRQQDRQEMTELKKSITIMSDNFAMFYKHIAVADEERKHDAVFKKETREFIKEATPIVAKAKDHQEMRGKLLIALCSFLMLGVLGAFYKF